MFKEFKFYVREIGEISDGNFTFNQLYYEIEELRKENMKLKEVLSKKEGLRMTYGFYLNNLQKVRIFRQLNQDQLANKLNVSLSTYRDIETLKRKAKCQFITKLEEVLNMPRNEIIGN